MPKTMTTPMLHANQRAPVVRSRPAEHVGVASPSFFPTRQAKARGHGGGPGHRANVCVDMEGRCGVSGGCLADCRSTCVGLAVGAYGMAWHGMAGFPHL